MKGMKSKKQKPSEKPFTTAPKNSMRKPPKYTTTIYKNGFVVRKPGRRITYLHDEEGSWVLTFARLRTEKLTFKDKSHFDAVVERFGLTYSLKVVHLSQEAIEDIAIGMMGYLRHVEHRNVNIEP